MRVICLVPSLTESLLECGVNVVGRTRFCIHPESAKQIPVVGGTKDLNWEKVKELKPDLLILDQEENLPWMKEQSPCAVHVCHVTSVQSMEAEMQRLAGSVQLKALEDLSLRWKKVAQASDKKWRWTKVPGQLQPLGQDFENYENLVYVIWKKPWMAAGPDTFIGSVLGKLGAGQRINWTTLKYPQFELEQFDLNKTFFLFSSEPYPFHREAAKLENEGLQGAIVDGEIYSWFGIRSLRFLEKA